MSSFASSKLPTFEGIAAQLTNWTSMLSQIQALLIDAEDKQLTEAAVNMWLDDLQDLAYDLDDLVDEFATEALRQNLKAKPPQASSSKKCAFKDLNTRKASSDRFPHLLLFPEETKTNGRVLISFQLHAFVPGYPVHPVIVRYPLVHFDQSWGNIALGKLMFRTFRVSQFHGGQHISSLVFD